MRIDNVTEADASELLEIYGPYVKNTAITFEYEVPSEEEFKGRIRTISEKYPYIKAVSDGNIIGYAYAGSFKGRRAYDWSVETTVYVRSDCRRSGIGKALYTELEKRLREMGILNMYACIAYPIEEDEYLTLDSVLFHEKLGFKTAGHYNKCAAKFGKWYDMVWMEKTLGEHMPNPEFVSFKNSCC